MTISWKELACQITITSSLTVLLYQYYLSKKSSIPHPKPYENGLIDLIGNTPIVKIPSLSKATGCNIYAKLELMNIGGSSKDRVAYELIKHFESTKELVPGRGDVIFEGTSGSTGISLTTVGKAMGYKVHIVVQDDTSPEKVALLKSLGAEVELVKPASIVDPDHLVNLANIKAKKMSSDPSLGNGVFANQFENDNNWKVHYNYTGPEIYSQLGSKLDILVSGVGTGGTISGLGKYLKSKLPNLKIYLADPQGSGFFNRINYGVLYTSQEKEGTRRRHQVDTIVEGIGLTRLTHNFLIGENLIDGAVKATDYQALKMARYLSCQDGFFWGSASAIAAIGCMKIANELGPNKNILMLATDSGNRHLSKFWKLCVEKVDENITLEEVMKDNEDLI